MFRSVVLGGLGLSFCLVISTAYCTAQESSFKFENKAANLQAYFQQMYDLVHTKKDAAAANKMLKALLPDEARAKLALRDDAPATLAKTIAAEYAKIPAGEFDAAKMLSAEKSKVSVYAATTEELIKYANGSVANAEFPSKAQDSAMTILRPGMTFYEVEMTEPTKDFGLKLHLLYWDGKQWAMLVSRGES
jgi:hypothetical protein